MTRYISFVLVAVGLFVLQTNATAQKNMTLDDAINYALTNSYTMKNSKADLADAEFQVKERLAGGLPQVFLSAELQHYVIRPVNFIPAGSFGNPEPMELSFVLKNNFTPAVAMDAMVFDGSFFVGLEAARAYRGFVHQQDLVNRREVKTKVVDAFLPVLLLDENVKILEKNIANLTQLTSETRELYKSGFVEQLDVDRLELSISNLQIQRDNLLKNREAAIDGLKYTLNYPLEEDLEVTGTIEEIVAEGTNLNDVELAINNRPEVMLSQEAIALNELNLKLNRSGYLPTLRATAAYQRPYQGDDFKNGFWTETGVVGLKLNMPLFDGMYKKQKGERIKLEILKAENQKMELISGIELQVSSAKIQYVAAKDKRDNMIKNLELANRIYNVTQVKYKEGIGSSLEVSQAEQSLFQSQANYLQALYELADATQKLKQALGL